MNTTAPRTERPTRHTAVEPDPRSDADGGTRSPWRIVAGREISVKLRDKAFLTSTATTLLIMIVSIGVSVFLGSRTEHSTVAVVDDAGASLVQAAGSTDAPGAKDVELGTDRVADRAALEQAVRDGDADAGLVRGDDGWQLVGKDEVDSDVSARIGAAVRAQVMQDNAQRAGTSLEQIAAGSTVAETTLEGDGSSEAVAVIAGFVFAFLFYLAAILFGYAIASSVVEEKQSRIVEIIAAAIPLRQLLVGKVVAATVLAMAQLALFVTVGLVGLSFTDYSSMLPGVAGAAVWFLVLFLGGFVTLAALFAVAGAMATRSEDVQSTSSPLLILVMLATFGSMALSGTGQRIASFVPLVSTTTMPTRLAHGQAAWWEPVVALLLELVVAAGVLLVAERVYRRSLLQTGGKLGWRTALRLRD